MPAGRSAPIGVAIRSVGDSSSSSPLLIQFCTVQEIRFGGRLHAQSAIFLRRTPEPLPHVIGKASREDKVDAIGDGSQQNRRFDEAALCALPATKRCFALIERTTLGKHVADAAAGQAQNHVSATCLDHRHELPR